MLGNPHKSIAGMTRGRSEKASENDLVNNYSINLLPCTFQSLLMKLINQSTKYVVNVSRKLYRYLDTFRLPTAPPAFSFSRAPRARRVGEDHERLLTFSGMLSETGEKKPGEKNWKGILLETFFSSSRKTTRFHIT